MKLINSKFFWLGLVVWLGVAYFSFIYLSRPFIHKTSAKYLELRNKQKEINSLMEREKILTQLASEKEEIEKFYNLAGQYLPSAREEGGFILQIKSNAIQSGETLNSITVQEKGKDENQYPFNISVTGNWDGLLNFLTNLENSLRLNQAQVLTLGAGEGDILSFSIQGLVFSKKEEKLNPNLDNIKISPEDKEKLTVLSQFTPLIDFESGIGRENPFTPY